MSTILAEIAPQASITIRPTSTFKFLHVANVAAFDQIVAEFTVMNPPTFATSDVKFWVKTANEELPVEGWDAYTGKSVDIGVTVAGTPVVRRIVWKREYDAGNTTPLQNLLQFLVENTTGAAITIDLRVTVAGTGCGCGK